MATAVARSAPTMRHITFTLLCWWCCIRAQGLPATGEEPSLPGICPSVDEGALEPRLYPHSENQTLACAIPASDASLQSDRAKSQFEEGDATFLRDYCAFPRTEHCLDLDPVCVSRDHATQTRC